MIQNLNPTLLLIRFIQIYMSYKFSSFESQFNKILYILYEFLFNSGLFLFFENKNICNIYKILILYFKIIFMLYDYITYKIKNLLKFSHI